MNRDFKADLIQTVSLLHKYIEQIRPQSFASIYPLYQKQKRQCELHSISICDINVSEVEDFARKEKIEKYGFR